MKGVRLKTNLQLGLLALLSTSGLLLLLIIQTLHFNQLPEANPNQPADYYFKSEKLYDDNVIDSISERLLSSGRMLQVSNLSYLLEPSGGEFACQNVKIYQNESISIESKLKLLIFVNSKWDNFERRRKMREKSLNFGEIEKFCKNNKKIIKEIKYFFVLALSEDQFKRKEVDLKVLEEAREFKDILVINLEDKYRDLSTKHLAAYKWLLLQHQDQQEASIVVLKSDDDNRIELSQLGGLLAEVNELRGKAADEDNWLMCAWFPANQKTIRSKGKWALREEEFPFNTKPAYCSGLAYLMPLNLIRRLYVVSHLIQFDSSNKLLYNQPLWIDDLYITGVVRSALLRQPSQLNAIQSYCFTRDQLNLKRRFKLKCTFLDLDLFKLT